jgi:ketosteroid isomerase-like protein
MTDEDQIRELIQRWAAAVHTGDMATVLADHAPDIVMYPLAVGPMVAEKAKIDYQLTLTAKEGLGTQQTLWINPSGDAMVGAWTIDAKGTFNGVPNSLRIGVMSHGKFTPLRFPPGFDREVFDREVELATITW